MLDTVIFVSNPFGFGPTGKLIAIMDTLTSKWSGHVVFAASEQCQEPLGKDLKEKIEVTTISERDCDDLKEVYHRYPNALVIVSLNRVATRIAKETGHVVFFIDSLTWMWGEIPSEYLLADKYYFYDIFGASSKTVGINHAIPILPILGHLPMKDTETGRVLIHIGGFVNPFSNGLAKDYLLLLWKAVSESGAEGKKLTIAGGSAAIQFLLDQQRDDTSSQSIELGTFEHSEFIQRMSRAERFITTSGSTAIFEALTMHIPIMFLPPTNLSQWRQAKLFRENGEVATGIDWEDILDLNVDLKTMSEARAVTEFENIAETVKKDLDLCSKAVKLVRGLISEPIQEARLTGQFTSGNVEGSEVIVSDILKLFASGGK